MKSPTNEIAFRYDVLSVVVTVFLAIEEVTKDVYAEVAAPTPESAAAFLAHLVAKFPQKIIKVTTEIRSDIHRLARDVRRRHGAGQSPSLRSRLPRRQDRPHMDESAIYKTL